jgi:hypothetical protein
VAPRTAKGIVRAFIVDPDGYQWAILAPLKPK